MKHAFPGDRSGKITVDYHSSGPAWTLAVGDDGDDGVGMKADKGEAKPGLGTAIVDALSRQLMANLTIADADPETKVSVVHS